MGDLIVELLIRGELEVVADRDKGGIHSGGVEIAIENLKGEGMCGRFSRVEAAAGFRGIDRTECFDFFLGEEDLFLFGGALEETIGCEHEFGLDAGHCLEGDVFVFEGEQVVEDHNGVIEVVEEAFGIFLIEGEGVLFAGEDFDALDFSCRFLSHGVVLADLFYGVAKELDAKGCG